VAGAGALGLATVAGVLLTEVSRPLVNHGLAISAGVTLYVAASNLVPELQTRRRWQMPAAFFLGAVAFFGTRWALEALGK